MHLTVVGQVSAGSSGDTVGGLAGKNYGKLVDCAFEGSVRGGSSVGGLVGINETTGQLINCRFQGSATGEHYVGGIAGQNTGSLVGCENQGDVNTTVVEVQADLSDITLLRTTESVPAGTDIGGIAGSVAIEYDFDPEDDLTESGEQSLNFEYNTLAVVLDCVNKGAVTAKKDNAGGIVGRMDVGAGAEESVVSGCCLWSSYCCWRRWARPGTSWAGLCSRPTTPTASCATSRAARTAR